MQPFDEGKFDSRYADVIEPAIREAGLEPYRVDNDPSSEILIQTIEEEIRKSKACIAEITTNNPNVWYELGFALALRKRVVIVCSDERSERFPFDVRHRNILKYKTRSMRDYEDLGNRITERLRQLASQEEETVQESAEGSDINRVNEYEIDLLSAIASESIGSQSPVSERSLLNYMDNKGYKDMAVKLAAKKLQSRGFIRQEESDPNRWGETYYGYHITPKGYSWIMDNEDVFAIRREDQSEMPAPDQVFDSQNLGAKDSEGTAEDETFEPDDDLPF